MDNQNIIEPKNIPIWTAAGLIVSILALAIAVTGLYRTSAAAVVGQAQVLLLNQKIEALSASVASQAANASPATKP